MNNRNHSLLAEILLDNILHKGFCLSVDATSRLIEDENGPRDHKRPGEGKQLPFATDQVEIQDMSISSPPWALIRLQSPTFRSADAMRSSVAISRGSRLKRTVPESRNKSCGMTLIAEWIACLSSPDMSQPPINTLPDWISLIRRSDITMDDFPLPDAPQIAIFSPGWTMSDRFFKTGGLAWLWV